MASTEEPLLLDQVLAGRKLSRNSGVIVLNIILSIVQLSSYATGYDGSMMSELNDCWMETERRGLSAEPETDGLQTLDTWQTYFNQPKPQTLGM